MSDDNSTLAISLFSEILTVDQLLRSQLAKVLPKGMELSHFSVLNHLAHINVERTPAQLAKSFHVTRGAMTNTLRRLETSGYVHIQTFLGALRYWSLHLSLHESFLQAEPVFSQH